MLNETDKAIANAYAMKTGMSEEEIIELMNKETLMNAQPAKKLGYIGSVLFEQEIFQNSIDTNRINILNASNCMIDESIISQMQKNKQSILSAHNSVKKRKTLAKLNLLKLGGRVDE